MPDLPTPAAIPPGQVVRIRLGGHVYTSPILAPSEAQAEAVRVRRAITDLGGGFGLFDFLTVEGRDTWTRTRAVTAVEVGPPPSDERFGARRAQGDVVNVHINPATVVPEGAAELVAAEARRAGYIPTGRALAARR